MLKRENGMPQKISVIIPVHNDKESLERCLASLFSGNNDDGEVIVIDDGSTDVPGVLLEKFPFHLVSLPVNKGPAFARNVGVQKSSGEIILFTDADCLVMQDWVVRMTEALVRAHQSDNKIVAICGRLTQKTGFWEQCHAYAGYGYVQRQHRQETDFLNTACAGVYKEAFLQVGGFSEDMRVSEDPELASKLVERGYKIIYEPDVHVFHDHGIGTCRAFFFKHKDWGRALGLKFMLKHPQKFPVLYPLLSHPVTHFLCIIPVAALTALKIFFYNIRFDAKVLLYVPFIFISKVFYRWGIFVSSFNKTSVPVKGTV